MPDERRFHAYPSWISMTAMKWSSEVIRNLTVKEPKCAMNVMNWQSTPCLWVNASKARCGGCSWYDPRSENLDYQTMTCCALPLFVIWLRHSSTHSIIMEFINSWLNIGQTFLKVSNKSIVYSKGCGCITCLFKSQNLVWQVPGGKSLLCDIRGERVIGWNLQTSVKSCFKRTQYLAYIPLKRTYIVKSPILPNLWNYTRDTKYIT